MESPDFDYKLFFDLSPDLVCIAGFDGYFKKVNSAVSKLLGYTKQELYSRPIDSFIFEEDRELTSVARQSITNSNTLFNFENRYVKKNGEIVWLAWTSQPVKNDQLVFAIAKNITHKKKIETESLALINNLTEVNNELKQLTLTTSHDLRSPISSLQIIYELLDISKISDKETLELIEILKLTGKNIYDTLNNYVDLLSKKIVTIAKPEETDLEQTLYNVLESISPLIQSSDTTLQTDFSEFSKIRFNTSYLESVYLNLITNAIKYSRPDYPPVITIQARISNGTRQLIIADNGLGFDMEKVKNKIFGLHQTFHNHEDSKGIGLYLVHNHITSLGGDIRVESAPDKGTRFIISFK
jgi:PAS domain S-box-containing protein